MSVNPTNLERICQFLYGQIEATEAIPAPHFNWLNAETAVLRQRWTNADVEIPYDVNNSPGSLAGILRMFLFKQPALTRAFHTRLAAHFNLENDKTTRIRNAYPNNVGDAGATDAWQSVLDMMEEIRQALQYIEAKYNQGQNAVEYLKEMRGELQRIKRLLPQVLIARATKEELEVIAVDCLDRQASFWNSYELYLDVTPDTIIGGNGNNVVEIVIPGFAMVDNIGFDQQMLNIRNRNYLQIHQRRAGEHLVPEQIVGLQEIYEDVLNTLTKVGQQEETKSVKASRKATVLEKDVSNLCLKVAEMTGPKDTLKISQRKCLIDEINQCVIRIDKCKLDNVSIDDFHRETLVHHKTHLMENQEEAESARRKEENLQKARAQESIKSAPTAKLQKLRGFINWLSWYRQAKISLEHVMHDQTKLAIIYNSLEDAEDKRYLRGMTCFENMMEYLKSKYNRPSELVSNMLGKAMKLKMATNDRKLMKQNILSVLSIYHDLKSYNMKAKIDSYFISQVVPRVFTKEEHARYVRKKAEHDARLRCIKAATDIDDDPGKAVDDSDESDDDSDKFSFVQGSEFRTNDETSSADRRFFITHLKETLGVIRQMESSEALLVDQDDEPKHGRRHGKKDEDGGSYSTEASERKCLVPKCTLVHKNFKGKPTNNFSLCKVFKKMTVKQRREIVSKNKACFICTTPGHSRSDCKSKKTCESCDGKHHTLLHLDDEANKEKPKAPKQPKAEAHKTEADEEESTTSSPEENNDSDDHAEANMSTAYELTSAESYYLAKGGGTNRMTCVAQVTAKSNAKNKESDKMLSMFDLCATHHFILQSAANRLRLKKSGTFRGTIRTIHGVEEKVCDKYEVKLKDESGNYRTIEAIVLDVIGFKPEIDQQRFKRLCKSFNIEERFMDQTHGQVEIIIGLKAQSLQAYKLVKFDSDLYPEVGIYTSVLTKKHFFVGCLDTTKDDLNVDCNKITVTTFKKFIEAEEAIQIEDPKCFSCSKVADCKNCKNLKKPASISELVEGSKMIEKVEVEDNPTGDGTKIVVIDYAFKDDIDPKDIYPPVLANKEMAKKASLNLRKKLEKENILLQFHDQIQEAKSLEHMELLSPERLKALDKLPVSYQLINYVKKDTSATTKLRVVTNSSINRINGSLNSNLMIGPNNLNQSYDVLNQFSAFGYSLMTDLEKAYRSVFTTTTTNNLRRFFWFKDPSDPATLSEHMMTRMTFGDAPSAFHLQNALNIIASDKDCSEETAQFINHDIYVDDGATSHTDKAVLEGISKELPIVAGKYGFKVKHCIKNYMQNEDLKTSSLKDENFLGLKYNWLEDTLQPNIEFHVGKKKRGSFTDEILTEALAETTTMTPRITLRTLAQCYDLSGRFLSPVQMSGRVTYSKVIKQNQNWDKAVKEVSLNLAEECRNWLMELVEVQGNVKPMDRAWVPQGYHLVNLIAPGDGSQEGYSAVLYARSCKDDKFKSNIATAKCKIACQTVPENELCALALNSKQVLRIITTIRLLKDRTFIITFITDSTCTAHSMNPNLLIKERKKRNMVMNINRNARKILEINPEVTIMFVWTKGTKNPADLNSKKHVNLVDICNSDMWRHGPKEYTSPEFPTKEEIVFMVVNKSKTVFTPFNPKCQEATCHACHVEETDEANLAANEVKLKEIDSSSEENVNCLDSEANKADKLRDNQIPIIPPEFYAHLTSKHEKLSNLIGTLATWHKITATRSFNICKTDFSWNKTLIDKMMFERILKTSQTIFKPKGILQLQPLKDSKGIIVTTNRMTAITHQNYFNNIALPIVDKADKQFCELLMRQAHVEYIPGEVGYIHLNKRLTALRLRRGHFGVHITGFSKMLKKFMQECPECKKGEMKPQQATVGNVFQLERWSQGNGLWSLIQFDIIGPFLFHTKRITRTNRPQKCWILFIIDMPTGCISYELLQNYGADAFIVSLSSHFNKTRKAKICTHDAGSQLKAGGKKMVENETADDDDKSESLEDIMKASQRIFKETEFIAAPTESQWYSGLVESNIKQAKKMLRSFQRKLKGQKWESFNLFQLNNVMTKIVDTLNDRPIFSGTIDGMETMVAPNDIMKATMKNYGLNKDVYKMFDEIKEKYELFQEVFAEEIVLGRYDTKISKKYIKESEILQKDDFVCIVYPSRPGFVKYGIVQENETEHMYKVLMIKRRNKAGGGKPEIESLPLQRLVLIKRIVKKREL